MSGGTRSKVGDGLSTRILKKTLILKQFWRNFSKSEGTVAPPLPPCFQHPCKDYTKLIFLYFIAHFVAHNKAVVAMEFDTNGTLLLTADSVGNYFNLYKVR